MMLSVIGLQPTFVTTLALLLWTSVVIAPAPAAAATASSNKCPLLPEIKTQTVELTLPFTSIIAQHGKGLPIEFHGIHPVSVIRKELKPYSTSSSRSNGDGDGSSTSAQLPKVKVVRYSEGIMPHISYNTETDVVTISKSSECSSAVGDGGNLIRSGGSSNTGFASRGLSWTATTLMTVVATLLTSSDNRHRIQPVTSSLVLAAGVLSIMTVENGFGGVMVHAADTNGGDESCMPVVQVIVEAPSVYKGVIETCLDEINDPTICPKPFPTYPTCDDLEPSCPVVVVGAGTGGLYAAMRMVDEGKIKASDVCIFEQTERVGGRLVSLRGLGPDDDLTVDAGGYRTWPAFTPTAHALITEYLGVPMDCYDDSEPCQVYNIVDDQGKKAGFATFVEEMASRLIDNGACFYPYHELTAIEKRMPNEGESISPRNEQEEASLTTPSMNGNSGTIIDLYFANGVKAEATVATILNIPQRPLLNIARNSNMDVTGLLDKDTLDSLHSVQTVIATKLYLYYPRGHVWWYKLGLRTGDFAYDGDARSMPLAGRYHDGPVYCDDENDFNTCHGFLLATYTNDLSGNKAQYFRRYQRNRPEPVTILSNQDLEGSEFLNHAHERLDDFHQLYNINPVANYTGFQASTVFASTSPPTFAILSNWNTAIPWAGGAWHAWTDLDNIEQAMQPPTLAQNNIFVINEAYSLLQGWAEGSIKLADEILHEHFDIGRPWPFPVVDVNQIVRQTNSAECSSESSSSSSSTSSGGSGSGGSGGGTSTAEDAILCFHGNSLIEMSDGTYKKIKDVKRGDFVATGIDGSGRGLVTEFLSHPVEKEVQVAVLDTPFGKLIGTPDHPVYFGSSGDNGRTGGEGNDHMNNSESNWVEFGDLVDHHSNLNVEIQTRFIDVFYNLEIDGDIVENAEDTSANAVSHSYVVNGITASGLGDHPILNRLYPRQKVFRTTNSG